MKTLNNRTLQLVINIAFAMYNFVLGIASYSFWFITVGAYYIILSIMRFLIVSTASKNQEDEAFVMKFSGVMILVLSFVLSGIVYMTVKYDVTVTYHEIAMITIAAYAFTKLTLAIIGFVKSKKNHLPYIRTVRSINLSDAVVSIYSLQRSMVVSFEGLTANDIVLFNTLSGIGMCIIVIFTGLNLIKERN